MGDGKWSGGAANRHWIRQGSRIRDLPGDAERSEHLYRLMADQVFLCDACNGTHPLSEHRQCRRVEAAKPNPGR
jgi:hypothetical protein